MVKIFISNHLLFTATESKNIQYLCPYGSTCEKALGQHFLTDQSIAKNIVGALEGHQALEVGPGMGVLTQYLLPRPELALKVIEIDNESVVYLKSITLSWGRT